MQSVTKLIAVRSARSNRKSFYNNNFSSGNNSIYIKGLERNATKISLYTPLALAFVVAMSAGVKAQAAAKDETFHNKIKTHIGELTFDSLGECGIPRKKKRTGAIDQADGMGGFEPPTSA